MKIAALQSGAYEKRKNQCNKTDMSIWTKINYGSDKLKKREIAVRHCSEGGPRNSLVKGEEIVVLNHPLPLTL
jgi:hypothetical protein